jgi:hypothetical protein
MTISAAFSINSTNVPTSSGAAVESDYGSTVTLALLSTTGAVSIDWTIAGSSDPDLSTPSITKAGSPIGATATFTFPATEQGIRGAAYMVKATVTDGNGDTATAFGIVGVPNGAGVVPMVAGETTARHATHGWSQIVNDVLIGAPIGTYLGTTTGSTRTNVIAVTVGDDRIARITTLWTGRDLTTSGIHYREASYLYKKQGGTLAQVGSDNVTFLSAYDATWAASHSGSGGVVYVSVKGDSSNDVEWRVATWKFEQRL